MSQNDVMNKSVRFHFIPHQHLLQSCVTFWCHKNVKSAVFVHRENRWRHSLIETPSLGWMTLCWVWWFSKFLLRSHLSSHTQSHNHTPLCLHGSSLAFDVLHSEAVATLWCDWWNTPEKKKSENLLSSTQIWSFSPTKPPPTNFHVFHVPSETVPPIYFQDFLLEAGQRGGGSSPITRLQHRLACTTLLGYRLKRSRSQIASFRSFFQAWSASPPSLDATL